ncbi:MAG: competence/damage-inducible protein A [Prolixibacteraceae bacterium]|nr:competence/damage-inducible protein A [Prolixibacteraceae bacterium]
MKAEIITIGDEILIGQIIETNSVWIAGQFNLHGIEIYQITSVHDNPEHIEQALFNAEQNADLIIITGGLGPTKDDITKQVLCNYFNTKLVFHEPTFEHIKNKFRNRNIDINKLNRDQALVPESCTVLFNKTGTAPGMWFKKGNKIFVSVPGVPFEMKYLVEFEILPRLRDLKAGKAIYHKTINTQGLPESILAQLIEQWENSLPENIRLAYLPNPMAVRLRLSAVGTDMKVLEQQVAAEIDKLKRLIPDNIYSFDNESLAEVIGKLLISRSASLAVAESCTGGYISHMITSVPGSSSYYKGGITAYSNEAKHKILGVNAAVIEKFGAVSEQVVCEMASGARELLKADYSIATSGIAGPGGGTENKPVGTVWIAVADTSGIKAEKYIFGDNRERNIIRSSQTALQMLRKKLIK